MTITNNGPDDSQIRFSLLDLDLPAIPPVPPRALSLIDECMTALARCTTEPSLDALRATWALTGSVYHALCAADRATVDAAGRVKRASLTTTFTPSADQTVETTLGEIAADSVRMAQIAPTTGPRARRQVRSQSPEAIALATMQAREAGARLAGYDGRIVDPNSTGLGTIVAFGGSIATLDMVSGRYRQSLVRWSDVEAVRVAAGLPERAFGRAPGLKGTLGQATQILNSGGYVARNVRAGNGIASAWKIGFFDNRLDSDSLGRKEALITLSTDGEISVDNADHPGARAVIADYDRRVAGTLIASDDLRTRIEACLVNHYGARDTDLGLYVSPYHASRALDLIVRLRPIAGRKIRAWSHTDRESISDALADSFVADLVRLESEIASKADDLKRIAGASLLTRIARLRAECEGLAVVLGADTVASYKARIVAMDATVMSALDSTSARAAQIELT